MKKRNIFILLMSLGLFFICLNIGSWLSQKKPVWNDEIYTQVFTIDRLDVLGILQMDFVEGNNNPLYYLIQEGISNLLDYRFPFSWNGGAWEIADPRSQFVMRISANVFMSLSLVFIFGYFGFQYSLVVGFYAFFLCLATPTIWLYWVEARPYSLWIFLTTIQLILLSQMLKKNKDNRLWISLFATNLLLSLTVMISLFQIFNVGVVLVLFRKFKFRQLLVSIGIPIFVCLFYFFASPTSIKHYRVDNFAELLSVSFPMNWVLFLFLFVVFVVGGSFSVIKKHSSFKISEMMKPYEWGVLGFCVLLVACAFFLAGVIHLRWINSGGEMSLSNRYFTYLAPVGIMMMTIFSIHFLKMFKKGSWAWFNGVMILGGFLVAQMFNTYFVLLHSRIY